MSIEVHASEDEPVGTGWKTPLCRHCLDKHNMLWLSAHLNTTGVAIPATSWDMDYQVRLLGEGEMGFKELVILLAVLLFSLQMQISHKTALFILIKVLAMMVFQEQKFGSWYFLFPLQFQALKKQKEHDQVYNFFYCSKQNISIIMLILPCFISFSYQSMDLWKTDTEFHRCSSQWHKHCKSDSKNGCSKSSIEQESYLKSLFFDEMCSSLCQVGKKFMCNCIRAALLLLLLWVGTFKNQLVNL